MQNPADGMKSNLSARVVPTGNKIFSAGTRGIMRRPSPTRTGTYTLEMATKSAPITHEYAAAGRVFLISKSEWIVGIQEKP